MNFRIVRIDSTRLNEYQKIPIAFEVRSIFDVTDDQLLIERPLCTPYIKDYDQIEGGVGWSTMDLTNWGIFLLLDQTNDDDEPIGGAMVAMPECALWDLRVAPKHRRSGAGRALVEHILHWLRIEHPDQRQLTIETQNTNVAACRFYASIGAMLIDVDREAYVNVETVKDEIRLNWAVALG